jgi:hypothetical protein
VEGEVAKGERQVGQEGFLRWSWAPSSDVAKS